MWWIAVFRIGIYRIAEIYRIVTMRCIVFTLTLALSHQGRGDSVGCVVLLCALPCGYCLEASMTGRCGWCWLVHPCHPATLWIADQVRNDVTMRCIVFTLCSRVRHWDRLWSSAVKGEGEYGWFGLVVIPCHPAALWILP